MSAPTSAFSREEELHWLALRLVPGLGARTAGKLLERFRTPPAVFRASRTELEGAGVSGAVAQSIASGCTFDDAAAQQQKMTAAGAVVVPLTDPRYPPLLREIYDPPLLLFVRGRLELFQRHFGPATTPFCDCSIFFRNVSANRARSRRCGCAR